MVIFVYFVAALCIGQQLPSVSDSTPKHLILFGNRCSSVVAEEFKNKSKEKRQNKDVARTEFLHQNEL